MSTVSTLRNKHPKPLSGRLANWLQLWQGLQKSFEERDWFIHRTLLSLESVEEQLLVHARGLAREMDELTQHLGESGVEQRYDPSINSLGAVQSRGHDVDRLVIERATLTRSLEEYVGNCRKDLQSAFSDWSRAQHSRMDAKEGR